MRRGNVTANRRERCGVGVRRCPWPRAHAAHAADPPLLARIFANHVVLQRDRPIDIWGQAKPGEEVTVHAVGRDAQRTRGCHRPLAARNAGAAGGRSAHADRAHRDALQNADDVLVGDVWLCSGQSNMEWAVRNALNADAEVAHSANDAIRHVTIPRVASVAPRADFDAPLEWQVAGPSTTQHFSAVCYYFARELQKTVNVPHGPHQCLAGVARASRPG